jgi:hypothetical protein
MAQSSLSRPTVALCGREFARGMQGGCSEVSTIFVADGRVLIKSFARRCAGASDDYTYGRRSPSWERHLAHFPLHVVSGENLVWVLWTDDSGA